ncbi:hypothetical protein [Paenibacillus sp. MMS20-IR301]|uniref:hypothetical protein n=1 Tax=Paenibacillus sp. MMS20-IR301 TaxID=2895946 RepID=UPI0028E1EC05|nr:hypothetical protein [Paenibacillus sp. MMS20-IR301]WNS43866.1 hypothetical protein LOS79_00960 [Paenibacillus sp. MMS20-IR301]
MFELIIIFLFLIVFYKFIIFRKEESKRLADIDSKHRNTLISSKVGTYDHNYVKDVLRNLNNMNQMIVENQQTITEKLSTLDTKIQSLTPLKQKDYSIKQSTMQDLEFTDGKKDMTKNIKSEGSDVHDELAKKRLTRTNNDGKAINRKTTLKGSN